MLLQELLFLCPCFYFLIVLIFFINFQSPLMNHPSINIKITGLLLPAILLLIFNSLTSCVKEPDDVAAWTDTNKWLNITTLNGLSGDRVYSITEDRVGNIWFGTDNGATRMDTVGNFSKFGQKEGIPGKHVFSVTEASDGLLYFGTVNGLTVFDKENVYTLDKIGDHEIEVYSVIEDSRKNLWIATWQYGAIYYSFADRIWYQPDYSGCAGCFYANSLFEDSGKNIWIGSNGGALKYDFKSLKKFTAADGLSADQVQSIAEDRWGDIWMGPRGGKSPGRYDGKKIELVTMLSNQEDEYIMDITRDKKGDLWFGMLLAGAVKFDGMFMRQYVESDGLKDANILSLHADSKGNIWFGTLSSGVYKFTPPID
jgi:ligand-binding sensor domain-containing protein